MRQKPNGNWVIFRDAHRHLGLEERDFNNALGRYDVHESLIPGVGMVGFTVKQLEWLRERMAADGYPKPRQTAGMVYIAKARRGRSFKIGFSTNPQRRLGELQTGQHGRLEILHSEAGTRAVEKAAHLAMQVHRQEGEWFALNEETRQFISTVTASGFASVLGANLGHSVS